MTTKYTYPAGNKKVNYILDHCAWAAVALKYGRQVHARAFVQIVVAESSLLHRIRLRF